MTVELNLIVACNQQRGIGVNGTLPWNIKEDMKFFQKVTTLFGRESVYPLEKQPSTVKVPENIVLMGRKTWESIPKAFRPLKNRINIVLSRNSDFCAELPKDVFSFASLEDALRELSMGKIQYTNLFIIGGGQLYEQTLEKATRLFITLVDQPHVSCDVFLPEWNMNFQECTEIQNLLGSLVPTGKRFENKTSFEFTVWERKFMK